MNRQKLLGGTLLAIIFQLCVSAIAVAAPQDKLNRAGLTATFNDEFEYFSWYAVDADGKHGGGTWATYLGYDWAKPDDLKNRVQFGNQEEAPYIDKAFRGTAAQPLGLDPFSVHAGKLHITASRIAETSSLAGYRYASGLISSQFSFSQRYGVFEMRAKLPAGKGLWPAFWLLPVDKSWPPEIDIMEILGHEPGILYNALHSNAGGIRSKSDIPAIPIADSSTGFHTYAVDWGPKEIVFYFDDKEVSRRPTPADMNTPFYIIANLAVGGGWPGSPTDETKFPASYEIDWIRAWQRAEYP